MAATHLRDAKLMQKEAEKTQAILLLFRQRKDTLRPRRWLRCSWELRPGFLCPWLWASPFARAVTGVTALSPARHLGLQFVQGRGASLATHPCRTLYVTAASSHTAHGAEGKLSLCALSHRSSLPSPWTSGPRDGDRAFRKDILRTGETHPIHPGLHQPSEV